MSRDRWPAFANAKQAVLPQAEVGQDRFHIAGYLNAAVAATRKDEHRRLNRAQCGGPVQTHLLGAARKDQHRRLNRARHEPVAYQVPGAAFSRPPECHAATVSGGPVGSGGRDGQIQECFRQFFACGSQYGAQVFFAHWDEAARALGNRHLTQVAQMLQKHRDGRLASVRHRQTNALAETLNGHIQRIKTNARGVRQFANFRVAILFFLGKLDLYPQTFR